MSTAPFYATWDGEALVALPRHAKDLDATLVIGERYRVELIAERSAKSHRFYFASINEAWHSLPEDRAEEYPSVEHLRKRALIACGYRDERTIVASSKAEALRLAAFIKPMDDFAVVTVRDCVVRVWTAQSQSAKAMGAKEFQRSKDAVLEYCASLIGVGTAELREQGEAA